MSETLYIVVPAYNESKNVEQLVQDWYPVVEAHNGDGSSRLVIIDDAAATTPMPCFKSCRRADLF